MNPVSSAENSTAPVNCERISQGINESTGCSFISWGMDLPSDHHRNCNAEAYTGSVCRQQLLAWQECAIGQPEPLFLDLTFMEQSLKERERDVAQFFHFLREFFLFLFSMCTWTVSINWFLRELWIRLLSESSKYACLPELLSSLWLWKRSLILCLKGAVWKNKRGRVWEGVDKCQTVQDSITKLHWSSRRSYKWKLQ